VTCRHASGDPACSSTPGGWRASEIARENAEYEVKRRLEEIEKARTPDSEKYEIVDVARVDKHLVMKVRYPNCAKCSFEGDKVMVFLNVTEADVLRWRRIDPHFRDPKAKTAAREAPSPAARFPARPDGWTDALSYARGKVPMVSNGTDEKK
jgi:hypothetical protein